MNRRAFLTAVLGSTTAALVLPQTTLAIARTADSREAIIAREWQLSYRAVHEQALLRLETALSRYGTTYPHWLERVRVGECFTDGTLCAHQVNVAARTDEPPDVQGTLEPAMQALAQRIVEDGWDRFGSPAIPPHGVEYADTIVGLRMVVQYDIDRGLLTRFDLCGGVSAVSRARLVLRDRARLKTTIRTRIAAYGRVPPLPLPRLML
jgi:hypothetical protein